MNAYAKPRKAIIYARLSVAAEESVSIARQIEAGRLYCQARGMEVVLVAQDDGVSASKTKPEDRDGWQEVLAAAPDADVVVVWKVDRLCRRVIDFLHADEALVAHSAGLVAVEDPIDMTTPQGRAFATMLAVFAELEAANTSARVKAARDHMARQGRVSAGDLPWPFQAVPNPAGPGYVARPIPARAQAVQDAASWLLEGLSISEVARRWSERGLPTASKGRRDRGAPLASWSRASVKGVMTNPALYGATKHRGELLRNANGTIKVDPERVILDRGTFKRVQAVLEATPRGRQPKNLPLLHGIARCAGCDTPLSAWRPSAPGRPAKYRCQHRDCPGRVTVGMELLDDYVVQAFAEATRDAWAYDLTEVVVEGANSEAMAQVEAELDEVQEALDATDDDEQALGLVRRRKALRVELDAMHAAADERQLAPVTTMFNPATRLAELEAVEDRRKLLGRFLAAVRVGKGTRGRHGLDEDRVVVVERPRETALMEEAG